LYLPSNLFQLLSTKFLGMNFAYTLIILFDQGIVMGIALYSVYSAIYEYIEIFGEVWADKIF